MINLRKHLLGLGLKVFAADAEPEKLAEAAEAVKEKDAFPEKPEPEKPEAKPEVKPEPKAEAKPEAIEDRSAADHRQRMHDALDCIMNARDKRAAEDSRGKDEDLEELGRLLAEFFEEEADEPEHQDGEAEPGAEDAKIKDSDPDEVELAGSYYGGKFHPYRDSDGYSESKGDPKRGRKRRAHDSFIEPVDDAPPANSEDSAFAVLKALRPIVARSKDTELRGVFNAQLSRCTRSSRPSNGGYAGFASAARRRAADAGPDPGENPEVARAARIQAAYDARRTGKPIQEVKK